MVTTGPYNFWNLIILAGAAGQLVSLLWQPATFVRRTTIRGRMPSGSAGRPQRASSDRLFRRHDQAGNPPGPQKENTRMSVSVYPSKTLQILEKFSKNLKKSKFSLEKKSEVIYTVIDCEKRR